VRKGTRTTKRDAGRKRKSKTRPGLPDSSSVVSETTLRSPAGRTYRVLRTTERDPYDPPDKPDPKRR
jgi:hypothetical protein